MSSEEERVNELLAALHNKTISEHIVYALGKMDASIIPQLEKFVETSNDETQKEHVIKALGLHGRKSVPILINLLKTEQEIWVKMAIIRTLGRMGGEAEDAVNSLLEIFNRDGSFYDEKIRWALKKIALESESAASTLYDHFFYNDLEYRLNLLNKEASIHIPLEGIIEKIRDKDNKQLNKYYKMLRELYPECSIPMLLEMLEDQDEEIRLRAVIAFRVLNKLAKTAVPQLDRARLLKVNEEIRFEIGLTLIMIEGLKENTKREFEWMRDNDELDPQQIFKMEFEIAKQEKRRKK